jgi:hypothetical protein
MEGLTPEQQARQEIDKLLKAAGWAVQDYKAMNLAAGRGVAVREFPTPTGPMDYMLYVDRRGIGSVEAKKVGETLLGVEPQADRYSEGFTARVKKDGIPFWKLPLPFHYAGPAADVGLAVRDEASLGEDSLGSHFSCVVRAHSLRTPCSDAASRHSSRTPAVATPRPATRSATR